MLTLLTPAQMYAFEKKHFDAGLPSLPFMERAARAVIDSLVCHFGALTGKNVAIACGPGNNGGDGYACALEACHLGARVTVLALSDHTKGDALICAERARKAGLSIVQTIDAVSRPDFWIDAIFGIGLNRAASFEDAIDRINADHALGSRVIAVDAPSGLNLTSGRVMGRCVRADLTVTFEFLKAGHVLSDGFDQCGTLDVRPVGFDSSLAADNAARLVQPADAKNALPPRPRSSHKGTFGHLLIIAGSAGMCGAANYATHSALRMGTGLVSVACPRSIMPIMQTLAPGAMCVPLPEQEGALSVGGVSTLKNALAKKTALVVGPGLSQRAAPEIVACALESGLPAVIDADALNLIALNPELKRLLTPHHVLTPHPGEAARWLGALTDPLADALRLHNETGAIALLKGASSVIAGENLFLSASGCSGMATGGSGDVLSGMIGALLAQGVPPETAAWCASHLHGLCGETASERFGDMAMTAQDLIDCLPETLKKLMA